MSPWKSGTSLMQALTPANLRQNPHLTKQSPLAKDENTFRPSAWRPFSVDREETKETLRWMQHTPEALRKSLPPMRGCPGGENISLPTCTKVFSIGLIDTSLHALIRSYSSISASVSRKSSTNKT